ncbi:helix-turn-helix transcriptional regulator [Aquipuribacter nitratireducens]|uniref:AAA family ATPase n=1 Tax=Aquipuribacter nitratireducens TaxID=650104 RepID=A0ABW0GPF3_9MICO
MGERPLRVVGREEQLAVVADVVDAARSGRAGLVRVTGQPGVGKSTFLRLVEDGAPDLRSLRVRGLPSEQVVAHAALHGLLRPVSALLARVPESQRAALAAALGWGPPAASDAFLVGAATLTLLGAAAEEQPVLLLVDDAQWLDDESAAAVRFAAERALEDRLAVVMAGRPGWDDQWRGVGGATLRLEGLSVEQAAAALPADTAPGVVERLVAAGGGNPLALHDVVASLSDEQRQGLSPLPDPLPIGADLAAGYGAAFDRLPAGPRLAAVLLALAEGDVPAVVRCLDAFRLDADAVLAACEDADVLTGGPQWAFRHPLVREAVLARAGASERRTAHAALAEAVDVAAAGGAVRRAWHLGRATVLPSEPVAAALADAAEELGRRRGHASAAATWEQAAALTPDPAVAARRTAAAVEAAFAAGDSAAVARLAGKALGGAADEATAGRVLLTLGTLEELHGSVPRAADLLDRAAERARGRDRAWALTALALVRFRLDDLDAPRRCAARLAECADGDDPVEGHLLRFLRGFAAALAGDVVESHGLLSRVLAERNEPALADDPRHFGVVGYTASLLGMVPEVLPEAERRIADARRRGAAGVLVPMLALTAAAHAQTGDHRRAYAYAGEAVELATRLGFAPGVHVAVEMLAWQAASRGLHDAARDALTRARELSDRAGTSAVAANQALVAAYCALCRDEPGEAVALLEARLEVDGGVGPLGEPLGVAPMLVEAYLVLGRTREARDLALRLDAATPHPRTPAREADVARTLAQFDIATGADPCAHLDAAEDGWLRAQAPFEVARTRLLRGQWLRRQGRRREARIPLERAVHRLGALDLTLWLRRAERELAATGATRERRDGGTREPLTAQETQVALHVATGLTNREVAAAMFLSVKTVEYHLGNVFRKRGYRTRAELAGRFEADGTLDAGLGP